MITGEGCEIQSLQQLLPVFNAKATVYVPQTIGARDCSLVTCLGLFYSWKEALNIRKDERISCDMNEMESAVESVTKKSTVDDEGGFTKKLKSILLNNDK